MATLSQSTGQYHASASRVRRLLGRGGARYRSGRWLLHTAVTGWARPGARGRLRVTGARWPLSEPGAAIRCKHCQASIPASKSAHGGVCPFCKEEIKTEAIRCMHCQADLAPAERHSCPGSGASQRSGPVGGRGIPPLLKKVPKRGGALEASNAGDATTTRSTTTESGASSARPAAFAFTSSARQLPADVT